MARLKRRTQHCQKIARKRKKVVEDTDNSSSNDNDSTEDEVEWADNKIEDEAEQIFSVLMKSMETLKMSQRPLVNLGNSRTTRYRRKIKALENQKKNGQTLFQLLPKKKVQENLNDEMQDINIHDDEEVNGKNNDQSIKYASFINQIEDKLKIKDQQLTPGYKMRLKAVQYYFQLLRKGHAKLKASQIVAELLNRGLWFARCVRSWAKAFKNYGDIPKDNRGQHLKGSSILDDEDIQLKVASYLRQHKFDITVDSFLDFISEEILPSVGIENKTTISKKTATRWLKKMGFIFSRYAKGIYVDRHEREDVVAYRKEFLEVMDRYQKLMPKFIGEKCEIQVNPELKNGERLHILVTHDETTFQSNDGQKSGWRPKNEQPLRKKRQGRSIHVSDFLTDTIGRLKLSSDVVDDGIPHEARVIINPGKNFDGWWNIDQLIDQIKTRAIPIFEKTHPGMVAVFAFDNSSSHAKLADDTLNAVYMNLNPGGKQPIMRDTIFNGQVQSMVFPANYPDENLRGKPKGMRVILQERGLWGSGLKGFCGNKEVSIENPRCCARHVLAAQEDFLNQKPILQEVIEGLGHKVIFYPKFHCELNYIEMYWGASKRYARQHCNYTWKGLQETVPRALDSVPLDHIRKYAQKSAKFMDCYRKGLTVL
ncbi:hypothetical protein RCL_jg15606.t1 [Rhizophagus clarus]|uniref:DDE-1 domain-containing protein n=1 Tax=Rhizophagus clarus TaxID=94130 RepID=A0A8H3KRT4_9GLOM|nr:hypothetical protein RCL_jg15606.t1 [Rhizophagus clarus]